MFDNLVEKLKANPKRIVYTEGTDARILESAARLKKDGFLTPVLLGNVEDVKAAAAKGGFDIEGLEIIDPENYDGMDAMVEQMVELRRGKMTADECRAALKKSNYFGTMLVKMGLVDSLLGGATYSTADTVRPALELADYDINSNCVAPGWVESEAVLSGDRWKTYLPQIPSRRLGKLSEIAESCVFLCNDKVSYINGEILDVNGAIIMD